MIIKEIKIHQLRNLSFAHLSLNPRFNFLIGPNGSGKTSLLEALYLLSCGHSFRSRELAPLITQGLSLLTVFAATPDQETISIQKSCSQATQIKINHQLCTTTSQLAYFLPCQVLYAELFQIIEAGSAVRRKLLDWGLFHLQPQYFKLWKEYKKVLKQRNALLKTHAPYAHFIPWDQQLNALAHELDYWRKEYFERWKIRFYEVLEQITDCTCRIHYFKGWDKKQRGKALDETLAEHFQGDKQKLYTQYGPHQADIFIESKDMKAKQTLSRGQQKMIVIALQLAQGALLDRHCLYLFDDLPAELDKLHQKKLLQYLAKQRGQYVITSLDTLDGVELLPKEEVAVYYAPFQKESLTDSI